MPKNVLIIGAGGVAQVVAHKLAQNAREFGTLHIASRTVSKAEQIAASIRDKGHSVDFASHALDAMDSAAVAALIRKIDAGIVINVGSAFVNMTVLQGCIDAGAAYIDTAIHEDPAKICETPPWYGNYEWKRREAVEAAYRADIDAAEDPAAELRKIEARLNALRSPFRSAEKFWVEEVIDPRKTRSLLCEFARLAEPIRKAGPPSNMSTRP